MKVEAKNLKIENIFKMWKFNIPDYQREYDRDIFNVEQLISDIESNEINYFIWHMVFEWSLSWNSFKVIDWQQRITSIVIILSALRDILYEKDEKDLALWLNNYIFSKDLDNKEYVILTSDMPYPIFQKYVQSLPDKKDKKIKPENWWERKIIDIYIIIYMKTYWN